MSRAPDPGWIRSACRLYSACLWLYPKSLRDDLGEEMRLAFRDRCREVATGQVSAWRVFGMEMLPDLVRSVGRAQADIGVDGRERRAFGGLILLCVLAIALLTQPQWSGAVTNSVKLLDQYRLMIREAREMKRYEKAITSVADELVGRGDPQSRALAALVHRGLFDQREFRYLWTDRRGWMQVRFAEEGARATALAGPLLPQAADAYTLSLATQACEISAGCNRDLAIRRLVAIDPDNAFGWILAFRWAAQHQRPEGMKRALEEIGSARYYENYQGRAHRDLFAAAERLRPGDADLLADVVDHADLSLRADMTDLAHDVLTQCSLREGGNVPVNWLRQHPESRADCVHLARLLANSTDLWRSGWGWRQLARAGEVKSALANETRRNVLWMYYGNVISRGFNRNSRDPNDHSSTPWQDADWKLWAEAWKPGDGQIPAMRRWLKARDQPLTAPADFQLPND